MSIERLVITFFETRRMFKRTDHLDILPDNLLHFLLFKPAIISLSPCKLYDH